MNTADRQDITLSVILLILLAVIIFSGVSMWMPHHNSDWMEHGNPQRIYNIDK